MASERVGKSRGKKETRMLDKDANQPRLLLLSTQGEVIAASRHGRTTYHVPFPTIMGKRNRSPLPTNTNAPRVPLPPSQIQLHH